MADMVNRPPHYCDGDIECKDAIREGIKHYKGWAAKCAGDVIGYIWRACMKNGVEDLKKAQWYLNQLVSEAEEDEGRVFIYPCNEKRSEDELEG